MDGPEIANIMPKIAMGICHHSNFKKPEKTASNIVPNAPNAIPIAANIPANLAISNGSFGLTATAGSGAVTGFTRLNLIFTTEI